MKAPVRPTMLWDGDCRFCGRWIRRWERWTGDAVRYRTYQEALAEFPQVREEDCERAVQLIEPDGRVFSAAHAVLRALHAGGRARWLLHLYQRYAWFRRLAEGMYRFIAANRSRLPGI